MEVVAGASVEYDWIIMWSRIWGYNNEFIIINNIDQIAWVSKSSFEGYSSYIYIRIWEF